MVGLFTALNIVDISEVFSPPRVVMQGMKIGLKFGSSMDLLTGWNFDVKADRDCDWLTSIHVFLELAGAQQTEHEAQRGMAGEIQRQPH